jgi:tetratricopeptide (TPR) repeat protein
LKARNERKLSLGSEEKTDLKRTATIVGVTAIAAAAAGITWWCLREASEDQIASARGSIGTRTAGKLLEQLRRDDPKDPEVQFLSARQARLESRWATASSYLNRAESLGWPSNEVALERLYILAGEDFGAARPQLQRLIDTDPKNLEALLVAAEGELQAGRFQIALTRAEQAQQIAPDHVRGLYVRGSARQLLQQRLDLARTDLETVYALGAEHVLFRKARLALGMCLLDLGEFGRAFELFRASRDDEPENALAEFGLGRAATYLGDFSLAEQSFVRVLELRPEHVETLISLAQLLEQRGDIAGAIAHLKKAEKREPDRLEVQSRLAKLLAAQGQTEQAAVHQARFREIDAARRKKLKEPE